MRAFRRGGVWAPVGAVLAPAVVGLMALAPTMAASEARRASPKPAACAPEMVASGTVQTIVDGRTFVLADGHEVRLPDIEVPPPPSEPKQTSGAASPEAPQGGPAPGDGAAAAVQNLLAGRHVALHASKLVTDRYGRILADALVNRDGYPGSIQKVLLSQGLAWISAKLGEPACLAELRTAERAGRAAKLGLWADPRYLPRQAEDVAGLSAERGRFTLVEGKIVSVRESGGTIYLNFGRRWSEDFTVTILKRSERRFIEAGLRPSGLSGRRVMVRGWIEERGGPWIEAAAPEQIEIIAEK